MPDSAPEKREQAEAQDTDRNARHDHSIFLPWSRLKRAHFRSSIPWCNSCHVVAHGPIPLTIGRGAAAMKGKSLLIGVGAAVSLAILATGVALSAQDKNTVKVPGGLGFADFKGYESWETIS